MKVLLGKRNPGMFSIIPLFILSFPFRHSKVICAFRVLPFQHIATERPTKLLSTRSDQVIFYSPNFHRHIVAEFDGTRYTNVLESFSFLDEAEEKYPNAEPALTEFSDKLECVAGIGVVDQQRFVASCRQSERGNVPCTIFMPNSGPEVARAQEVVDLISGMLGAPFFNFLPKAEHGLVCERLQFFLATARPGNDVLDVPKAFFEGYGLGLSVNQTVSTLVVLRDYLAPNPAQALKLKASAAYIVSRVGVPVDGLNEAREKLERWLDRESSADTAAFAYLRTVGISWDQCHTLIQAFSLSILTCELERTFEVFNGPHRDPFSRASIDFLRARFQLLPVEVIDMIRLHPRLTTYSENLLRAHSDAIQMNLGLKSRVLKEIVQKQPSILGISESKIEQRVSFLVKDLSLSPSEIQVLVPKIPSLLEYSLDQNLKPKLEFLADEVGLSGRNLTRVVLKRPSILTQSLRQSLKPSASGLRKMCNITPEEMAGIVVRNPSILTAKWLTNLKPKIEYLVDTLRLEDNKALKVIIQTAPTILTQSISTSLQPKMKMLEDAAGQDARFVFEVVRHNPSLLVTTKAALQKRVNMFSLRNVTFVDAFSAVKGVNATKTGNQRVVLTRRKRVVLESSDEGIVQELPDIREAAQTAGTTKANMYNIISSGRKYNGKSYAFGSLPDVPAVDVSYTSIGANTPTWPADILINVKHFDDAVIDLPSLLCRPLNLRSSAGSSTSSSSSSSSNRLYLAVHVSGGTFNPQMERQTGAYFARGAMAVYFPQLRGRKCEKLLLNAVKNTFEGILLPQEAGTDLSKGLVLSFFPAEKATRNRCTLFACSNALRLVVELLASEPSLKNYDVHVDMITDSSFVWQLLSDSAAVMQWGSYSSGKEFLYDGKEKRWNVHPDILYPVSRTYFRLLKQLFDTPKFGNRKEPIVKEVSIDVRHQSELAWTREDQTIQMCRSLTAEAAKFHYERGRALS